MLRVCCYVLRREIRHPSWGRAKRPSAQIIREPVICAAGAFAASLGLCFRFPQCKVGSGGILENAEFAIILDRRNILHHRGTE